MAVLARRGMFTCAGEDRIVDRAGDVLGIESELQWTRQAGSFFQGNRFLVGTLTQRVLDRAGGGNFVDLYAGVGLFAVALAHRGASGMAVEGDAAGAFTPRTGGGVGVQNGERAPLWVCASVRLQTAVRGRMGQGRTGIGPLAEMHVTGDSLAATFAAPFLAAVRKFHTDLVTDLSVQGGELAVISRYKGVDAAGKPIPRPVPIGSIVTSLTVNTFLGSRLTRHPGR